MTEIPSQEQIEAKWDFYQCKVDDAPASISLNLGLLEYARTASESTLYALRIQMLDDGPHGMGDQSELDALGPVEDAVVGAAEDLGARYVGRLRNNGNWQLTFMGPEGIGDAISHFGATALEAIGRESNLVSQPDADWAYYSNFLYPSPERIRWMGDRRVVDSLTSHGDDLTVKRRVDHWVYFDGAEARESFVSAITAMGFELLYLEGTGLQVHRVDSVRLDSIHELSEELNRLAETNQGNYDGWETSVEN